MKALRIGLLLPFLAVSVVMAQDDGDESKAPELVRKSGEEYSLVGSDEKTVFEAKGGRTSPPPEEMGGGIWKRTGSRLYVWRVIFTNEEDVGKSHPLDGTVTEENLFVFSTDVAGSFNISVSLHEEWEDESKPARTIYWPPLPEAPEKKKP